MSLLVSMAETPINSSQKIKETFTIIYIYLIHYAFRIYPCLKK